MPEDSLALTVPFNATPPSRSIVDEGSITALTVCTWSLTTRCPSRSTKQAVGKTIVDPSKGLLVCTAACAGDTRTAYAGVAINDPYVALLLT